MLLFLNIRNPKIFSFVKKHLLQFGLKIGVSVSLKAIKLIQASLSVKSQWVDRSNGYTFKNFEVLPRNGCPNFKLQPRNIVEPVKWYSWLSMPHQSWKVGSCWKLEKLYLRPVHTRARHWWVGVRKGFMRGAGSDSLPVQHCESSARRKQGEMGAGDQSCDFRKERKKREQTKLRNEVWNASPIFFLIQILKGSFLRPKCLREKIDGCYMKRRCFAKEKPHNFDTARKHRYKRTAHNSALYRQRSDEILHSALIFLTLKQFDWFSDDTTTSVLQHALAKE